MKNYCTVNYEVVVHTLYRKSYTVIRLRCVFAAGNSQLTMLILKIISEHYRERRQEACTPKKLANIKVS